ncbi:hypothetical protein [Metabacillus sp. RGM 3146]|uniref:hypothetical protein n=1 Tax=Metabacillus sp. RGM 3146 TaxID=3401092 RepID=UPI003B999877
MKRKTLCFSALLSAGLILGGCGLSSKETPTEKKAESENTTKSNADHSSAESSKESVSSAAKKEPSASEKESDTVKEKSTETSSGSTNGGQEMPAYDGLQGSGGSLENLANGPEIKVPADVKTDVLAMLKKNLDTLNKEDLNGYMATLSKHPAGFNLDNERQLIKESFASADVKTSLLKSKIVAYEKNVVTVYVETKVALVAPKAMEKKTLTKSLNVFIKDPEGWRVSASMMLNNTDGKME